MFNKEGHFVAERVIASIQIKEATTLIDEIQSKLETHVEAQESPDYDAWSPMNIELDFAEVDLVDWTVHDTLRTRVLTADEDTVSFTFEIEALLAITGHFRFGILDDKDSIPKGSTTSRVVHRQPLQVSVAVDRKTMPNPVVWSVEIESMRGLPYVRFGEVEPDSFYDTDD